MNEVVSGPLVVDARQLSRRFGAIVAVDHLSLSIGAGEVFGLIGPNGAGKSTLMKMFVTLLPPSSGKVLVAGFDVARAPQEVRRHIGYVPQVLSADGELTGYENFIHELKTWLRFSPRHALVTGDGLFSATSGSPPLPDWLGQRVFDLAFKAKSENETYVRQLASSAGVAVFVSQNEDKAHWVAAGRACQRFALQATALGLQHAFVNQPVEVASVRAELATLLGRPGSRPDLVMRFGYGEPLPYSARRPTARVLIA